MGFRNLFFTTVLLVGMALPASATTLYAPQACAPKDLTLTVKNVSGAETFWVQTHQGEAVRERRFDLDHKGEFFWNGSEFLKPGESFVVKHFTDPGNLMFLLKCRGLWRFDEVVSPSLEFSLSGDASSFQFLVQNLDPLKARGFHLHWKDADGFNLGEAVYDLQKPYSTSEFLFTAPVGARTLLVEGGGRLSARLLDVDHQEIVTSHIAEPTHLPTEEETAYFLLSNSSGSESFVLPLKDSKLVAEARTIIAQKTKKILTAEIESPEGFSENRNFSSEDLAPWSWKIRKALGFSDFASIECSGTPALVEERLRAWLKKPVPRICFWSFFPTRELSADEVASGILKNL